MSEIKFARSGLRARITEALEEGKPIEHIVSALRKGQFIRAICRAAMVCSSETPFQYFQSWWQPSEELLAREKQSKKSKPSKPKSEMVTTLSRLPSKEDLSKSVPSAEDPPEPKPKSVRVTQHVIKRDSLRNIENKFEQIPEEKTTVREPIRMEESVIIDQELLERPSGPISTEQSGPVRTSGGVGIHPRMPQPRNAQVITIPKLPKLYGDK